MVRVLIDNSTCRIEGLALPLFNELRKEMSYEIDAQAAHFSRCRQRTRFLLTQRGDFPTGLLYIVNRFLSKHHIRHERHDKRLRPPSRFAYNHVSWSWFTGCEIPEAYLEQREAACAGVTEGRGIIVAPTGVGKSRIAAEIIDRLQVRTLIVVPGLELKRQLLETLTAWFGPRRVGELADKRDVSVENVAALDPTKKLEGIDLLIIDEFHHSGAESYRKLNKKAWSGIFYKIGLTATPFRSKESERLLLESVLSKVIYQISYKTAVQKGYIVPIEAYYFDLPTTKVRGSTWNSVYSELVVKNDRRNRLIVKLLGNLGGEDAVPTLCLVKEISHGRTLSEAADLCFANGQDELSRRLIQEFNQGERKHLIGTTGIIGEGVDTKPAEYVILAGAGKSKNAFMQQVGRGVRRYGSKESCKVILFRDRSHKWLLRHFNACARILKEEYGVKPVKLTLPEGI